MADEPPIHVLHLADLLVADPPADPWEDYGRMVARLAAIHPATEPDRGATWFDYVTICGNLTRDGTEQQFRWAEKLIERLAVAVLHEDLATRWRERLIVVPGATDLPGNNHAEFDAMYQRLGLGACDYEEPAGGPWHCSRTGQFRVTVRTDRRLTAVGFYWNPGIPTGAEALWAHMRDGLRSWSAGHPVLLVSSSVPFPMAREDYFSDRQLVHLLGRVDQPMLDRVRYHALSWEPGPPSRLCRAHILALRGGEKQWARVQTCEFGVNTQATRPPQAPEPAKSDTPPRPFTRALNDLLDRLNGTAEAPPVRPAVPVRLSPEYAPTDRKKVFLIRGLPGVGKFGFFQEMKYRSATGAGSQGGTAPNYHVEPVKLWFSDPHEECTKAIRDAKQRLLTAYRTDQARGILMVFKKETPAQEVDAGVRVQCQRALLEELRNTPGADPYDIVYLTDDEIGLDQIVTDYKKQRVNRESGPPGLKNPLRDLEEFWLSPLGWDEWQGLLAEYPNVALDVQDLSYFTGGLHGLSVRVLEAFSAAGTGAEGPVTRKSRWADLLGQRHSVQGIGTLDTKLRDFIQSFPELLLVREHLERRADQIGLSNSPPPRRGVGTHPNRLDTSLSNFRNDITEHNSSDPSIQWGIEVAWRDWRKKLDEWGVERMLTEPDDLDEAQVVAGPAIPYIKKDSGRAV